MPALLAVHIEFMTAMPDSPLSNFSPLYHNIIAIIIYSVFTTVVTILASRHNVDVTY